MNLGVETNPRETARQIVRKFQHSLMNLGVETRKRSPRTCTAFCFSIL